MYSFIKNYILSCDICQRVKRDTQAKNAPLHPLPIQDMFARWHMDILSGLPKTKEGYQYILLVTDSFSHWSEAVPLKTQEAQEVADKLYSEIFTRYGACRTLISDRAQNFMSKVVSILCKLFNVTRHYTSSYHPQSNVACERLNSTIAQSLRAYCSEEQQNWPNILPSIMMAFRMSPSTQSSHFSPYYMLFGKEMPLPIDTALIPEELIDQAPEQYIDEVIKRVKIIHDIAKSNIENAQDKHKQYYDKKTKIPTFKVGDRVFLKIEKVQPGKKKKLEPKWMGPYSIMENRHNLIYKLLDLKSLRPVKSFIHANRLKPYHDPRDFRPPPQQIALENDNDSNDSENDDVNQPLQQNNTKVNKTRNENTDTNTWYEATKLLKSKWVSGKRHYLVEWKDNSPPSWQAAKDVSEALKTAFHTQQTQKRRRLRKIKH